jgi:glycosyltransferase involved in cell wall biosynthesis
VAPAFSVIIPTYGRPAFLAAAVESVLSQTCADLECIVVDDASPVPQSLPADDPRLRLVVRDRNGGPAAARNAGMTHATGTHLAFLDDDDVWVADRLARALDAHRRAPVVTCWQATLGQPVEGVRGRSLEGHVADTILDGMTPHLGATSIERERALPFDERYATTEDVDWWLRIASDLPVATVEHVGLLYRVHDGPRRSTGPAERLPGARLLLEEHVEWFRTHPAAHAFRLKRLGLTALQAGDRTLARSCFVRSFRLHPDGRTAWHALRSFAPVPAGAGPHNEHV